MEPCSSAMLEKATSGIFPAGFPHSIPGVGPDGLEFILIFDQVSFSEDNTFLLSDWVRRTPPSVLSQEFWPAGERSQEFAKQKPIHFPAELPASLAQDKASIGGGAAPNPVRVHFQTLYHGPHAANEER